MAYTDAQGTNNSSRSNKTYSDLNLNFTKNPATNDVARLTDVEAVRRSVRNLILTNEFERPFHPEIGSSIRGLLFESHLVCKNFFFRIINEDKLDFCDSSIYGKTCLRTCFSSKRGKNFPLMDP